MGWGKLLIKLQIFSISARLHKGQVQQDRWSQLTSRLRATSPCKQASWRCLSTALLTYASASYLPWAKYILRWQKLILTPDALYRFPGFCGGLSWADSCWAEQENHSGTQFSRSPNFLLTIERMNSDIPSFFLEFFKHSKQNCSVQRAYSAWVATYLEEAHKEWSTFL